MVEEQLRAELTAIETLLATNGLLRKHDPLDKVRKQLAGISALVDLWWQTVRQDLTQLVMTPRWTQWAKKAQAAPLLVAGGNEGIWQWAQCPLPNTG